MIESRFPGAAQANGWPATAFITFTGVSLQDQTVPPSLSARMDVNQRAVEPSGSEASIASVGMGGADVPCVCARETDLFLRMRLEGVHEDRATSQASGVKEALRAETRLLKRRLAQEIKARKNLESRLLQEVERRERRVKEHLSYRLGKEIVEAGHSPLKWLKLPGRLIRVYDDFRKKKADAPLRKQNSQLRKKPSRTDSQRAAAVLEAFKGGGAAGVIASAEREVKSGKPGVPAVLLEYSKLLRSEDHQAVAAELTSVAYGLEKNSATMRALYWVLIRQGDFRKVGQLICEVEELQPQHASPGLQRWLEDLRSTAVYNVRIVEALGNPRAPRFDMVRNRIVYVLHNSVPFSSGGYATRSHGVATALRAQGWDVVAVLRPGFPRDLDVVPEERSDAFSRDVDGIRYHFAGSPMRTHYSKYDYMLRAAEHLEICFAELKPELVVAASAHFSALPALIAARRLGLPFVYEVRGFWEITRLSRKPSRKDTIYHRVETFLEAFAAQEADLVFTLTEAMREELLARNVHTPIRLAPNSCDPNRFVPRPRDQELAEQLNIPDGVHVIGYVGTFVDYEGLEYLADACSLLHARHRDFRLLLVGNENTSGQERGTISHAISSIAEGAGFADKLIMPGRVPHEMVERYYSLVDIAAFPRRGWPVTEMVSPIKPLEALSMEKAVVASNVRALSEMIIDGETGLLFRKEDVADLAEKLEYLIARRQEVSRLGSAARRWVIENRRWEKTAAQMSEGLKTVRHHSLESRSA